ncbi:MAG TPA: TlpA disulfide reductase family protein [Bacteroidales bacterium]|nr:AhpC/TSA family protein [Bacteroidales bacterium]HCI55873.1 hypothetical protein [Bacteroidales bacterium]HOU96574.1 TlpA disulfide reductase family protein [Bacteroidales bacterium]HQG37156.1 TlpA disulfide reductase family protein [Bacteroidales bacterium]HQG53627.1 TlpA disulfide reductase family protein [Bacteroidales bacterium]
MKHFTILTRYTVWLIFILLFSCKAEKSFRIEGKSDYHTGSYIRIHRIDIDVPVLLDSAKIKKNGSFRFKIKAEYPEFYQLGIPNYGFITLLAEPGEKIDITFKSEYLPDNYSINGSPGTRKLMVLDSALAITRHKIDSLKILYDSLYNTPEFAKIEKDINEAYLKLMKDQRMFNIDFILKNLHSFASIKALYQKIDDQTYVLYDPRDIQFLKIVSDTLNRYFPKSKQVRALKANFEKEMNAFKMEQLKKITEQSPIKILDPDLKDINGKRIALSSLRGKYVLLSFWSAASEDCISENLQLKKLYEKYRNKGFEIYQINLDSDEELWKRAVTFDELPWINVREDDPANPKFAIYYNVKTLPTNYLYNKEGEIIASNLHGSALQNKLQQIFGY